MDIGNIAFSDHASVSLCLSDAPLGPGSWRLDESLVSDVETFPEIIKELEMDFSIQSHGRYCAACGMGGTQVIHQGSSHKHWGQMQKTMQPANYHAFGKIFIGWRPFTNDKKTQSS